MRRFRASRRTRLSRGKWRCTLLCQSPQKAQRSRSSSRLWASMSAVCRLPLSKRIQTSSQGSCFDTLLGTLVRLSEYSRNISPSPSQHPSTPSPNPEFSIYPIHEFHLTPERLDSQPLLIPALGTLPSPDMQQWLSRSKQQQPLVRIAYPSSTRYVQQYGMASLTYSLSLR